jgi:hypothetical protein
MLARRKPVVLLAALAVQLVPFVAPLAVRVAAPGGPAPRLPLAVCVPHAFAAQPRRCGPMAGAGRLPLAGRRARPGQRTPNTPQYRSILARRPH